MPLRDEPFDPRVETDFEVKGPFGPAAPRAERRPRRWREVLLVVGWFVLAVFVMLRLLEDPSRLDSTLAAWLGGVLSVPFGLLVWRLFGPGPVSTK